MGRLQLIFVDFTADGVALNDVYLRPPKGKEWRVIEALAFHDDGTARDVNWFYKSENLGLIYKGVNTAVAAATRVPITSMYNDKGSTIIGSLILRYNMYAGFHSTAYTVGTIAKIRALVEEYDGPDD